MNGIQISHPFSPRMGENIECKTGNRITQVVLGVQATDHQTQALDDRKQRRAVGDHNLRVDAELPEWLQPFTEGLTSGSSSSTDVSAAEVEIPPPANSLSAHPPSKPNPNNTGGKHKLFTHFPKDPTCEECRPTTGTRAPCRRNPDDRAYRVKIAERLGDVITANHKVLNEEELSLHHKCAVVVQDVATRWVQSYPCKTKSSQETQRSLR